MGSSSKLFLRSKASFSTKTAPFPSFRAAKKALLSEPNPDKLAQLFQHQSTHYPGFHRHRPIFEFSIRKLSRAHRPDLVDQLLQSYLSKPQLLASEGFLIRLLMLYSQAGMVPQAMLAFHRFHRSTNFPLTEKSLCAVLSMHLDNHFYDEVHQLFDEMPQRLGVAPGVVSHNLVLKAFVKQDKLDLARDWIEKMKGGGKVLPSIDSYNVLMGGYLTNGDLSGFDGVVKEVLNLGLENNVTAYNYRISRFCKSKECVRAKKLLDEMISRGVNPNSASYNMIIDGFCRLGDFELANKVLERMLADGYVSPCSFTYYSLIRNMVKEVEFDSGLDVFGEIIKRKWVPPFEPTEGLVRGLVSKSRVEDAKKVVEDMKKLLKGEALLSWGKIEVALPL